MSSLLHLLLCASPALAQAAGESHADAPPADVPASPTTSTAAPPTEAPLAIPMRPGVAAPPTRPPGANEAGGLTPDRLAALRTYRDERLVVRGEAELTGGAVYGQVGGWYGYPHRGYGGGWVVADPLRVTRGWGIYQGPRRVDVPTFLGEVGEAGQKAELDADISRASRNSQIWFTAAGIGAAALLTGFVGSNLATTPQDAYQWSQVSFVGATTTVVGLVGGSFPSSKAQRLRRVPAATMSVDEATRLATRHNEQLREKLGLSPDDVWRMEQAPPAAW
jgi:hypothetical protein